MAVPVEDGEDTAAKEEEEVVARTAKDGHKQEQENGVPTPAGREQPPGLEACIPSQDANGTDHHGPAGRGASVTGADLAMVPMVTTATANPTALGAHGAPAGL